MAPRTQLTRCEADGSTADARTSPFTMSPKLRAHAMWRGAVDFFSGGHAIFDLVRAAWREFERDYARYFAGAMVYYALVSLVPLLLLLLAALGLLLRYSDLAAVAEQQVLLTIETSFGAELCKVVSHREGFRE